VCAHKRRGAGTPKTLGVTADVRLRGPHWGWSHALKATKPQRAAQGKKAAVQAQDSAASSASSRRDRGPAARSLHTSVPAWSAIGQASLGDSVWKGHAV
jgi:hypothetical protein